MAKRKLKPYVVQASLALVVIIVVLTTVLLTNSLDVAANYKKKDLTYVSYEILSDKVEAVMGEKGATILKPFTDEGVKVAKSFYDYTKEAENQKSAIIYYENTYIQNTGIDFSKDTIFEVVAILDGKVISVTDDELLGKTIKIQHDNEIISIYQSLSDIKIKQDDIVKQGQLLGSSGENTINSAIGNHLHFELVYKSKLVNPEEYFDKKLKEI